MDSRGLVALLLAYAMGCALSGCASPVQALHHDSASAQPASAVKLESRRAQGARVARVARAQLGAPYRFGGSGPRAFDCSGLVHYAHARAGLTTPRTAAAQYAAARRVALSRLQPGDLLFFRLTPPKVSHVAVYIGEGRFIHAPSTGKRVSLTPLDHPYWRPRLMAAGRLH